MEWCRIGAMQGWSDGESRGATKAKKIIKSLENNRNEGDWVDYMVKEEWAEYGEVEQWKSGGVEE